MCLAMLFSSTVNVCPVCCICTVDQRMQQSLHSLHVFAEFFVRKEMFVNGDFKMVSEEGSDELSHECLLKAEPAPRFRSYFVWGSAVVGQQELTLLQDCLRNSCQAGAPSHSHFL